MYCKSVGCLLDYFLSILQQKNEILVAYLGAVLN